MDPRLKAGLTIGGVAVAGILTGVGGKVAVDRFRWNVADNGKGDERTVVWTKKSRSESNKTE